MTEEMKLAWYNQYQYQYILMGILENIFYQRSYDLMVLDRSKRKDLHLNHQHIL